MKKIIILACASALFFNCTLKGSIEPKLSLDQEIHLSTKDGVIKAAAIARTGAGSYVKFYRPDGSFYTGIVNLLKEEDGIFEIQGTITNCKANFGFKIAKGGIFVGAVVEHEAKKTYVLEFSLPHKGFILVESIKYNIEA